LPELLHIALRSIVGTGEDLSDMGNFTECQLARLRQYLPMHLCSPSCHAYRNVLMAPQLRMLLEVMELWLGDLDGKQDAVDGKVRYGAKDSRMRSSTLRILRARSSEASLSVGQEVCLEKSNELEALP
jgi:hypothetical protein